MLVALLALAQFEPQWYRVADEIVPTRTVYALNAFVHKDRVLLFEEEGVWSSLDGKGWSLVCPGKDMPGSPAIGSVVECNGQIFVLGTVHGTRAAPDEVWTSRDGKSWTGLGRTLPAQGVPVSDGARVWLIATQGRAWSSADGATWREEAKGGWSEPQAALLHEGALRVFETKGDTWERTRAGWSRSGSDGPWVGRWRPSFASCAGSVWMIGGSDKTDYWVFEGAWKQYDLPLEWRPRATPRLVGFNSSLFVFGGKTGHPQDSNPQSVWLVR